jgi:hypothetical protein
MTCLTMAFPLAFSWRLRAEQSAASLPMLNLTCRDEIIPILRALQLRGKLLAGPSIRRAPLALSSGSLNLFLQLTPAPFRLDKRHRQGGEFVMKAQRLVGIGRLQ